MRNWIAKENQAFMTIVVASDASPSEQYAASELRAYLERITLAPFELAESPFKGVQFAIGKVAETFGVTAEGLGEDGFHLKTMSNGFAIAGGKRGVLYGVYEFLEQLGCRFFTATCERIPHIPALALPQMNDRQIPVLELRAHNYYEIMDSPRFGVKLRMNGSCAFHDPEKLGGYMEYAGFVHTFELLVPTEVYGETHPEYFSLDETGKRNTTCACTQLCLTNPEVLQLVVENTRKLLREKPGARLMSISQNDWGGSCQCPDCLKSDQEEGGSTGTLIRFVNAVAEQLEAEFPQVIFDTLAYQYTRPVPVKARPRKNVCIRLCSIECCFSHSFESCNEDRGILLSNGQKTSFIEDLRGWGKVHDRVYIWDYVTSFSHYPAPHPNWRTLQPNIQAMVKNNVKGIFEQANGAKKGGCDLNELRAYLLSKLLWNPDTDINRHLEEFTDYYYGKAAPYIRAYIDLLCDKAERDNIHIGYNDPCDSPLFCEEMLVQLEGLLAQAASATTNAPLHSWRVGKLGLSVRYLRIKRRSMLENKNDDEEISTFFRDWKEYGLSRVEEWVMPETSHRAFLHHRWRGVEFYKHWTDEGRIEEF